jgi:hypothetical protein
MHVHGIRLYNVQFIYINENLIHVLSTWISGYLYEHNKLNYFMHHTFNGVLVLVIDLSTLQQQK